MSPETVAQWMEAARRRGLITRSNDARDTAETALPAVGWNLTADGRARYSTHRWHAALDTVWQVAKSLIPVLGLGLALVKAVGVETLP